MPKLTPAKLAVLERGEIQGDLAQKLRINRSRLCDILNDRISPNSDERYKLSKALDTPEAELFPRR